MLTGTFTFCTATPITLDVAVPETEKELQWGLQSYDRLNIREGMVFFSRKFPKEDPVAMWIAKVTFPVSMIWFSKDLKVIKIQEYVYPGDTKTYTAGKVLGVIEVHPELPKRYGIEIGTIISPYGRC